MRCPSVGELPAPPPGKSGWPWTSGGPQLPERTSSSRPWPRVSIVTPSYNQGAFLEETIRSVILQGYPDIEYMAMDGGSTDESVEILRRYEPWLVYWVSERDSGQTDAINKGFARATGEIVAWLNSDDVYLPGAIGAATEALVGSPDWGAVYGNCRIVDERGRVTDTWVAPEFILADLPFDCFIPQPATFFRRQSIVRVGMLRSHLDYVMDYDLWLRMVSVETIHHLPALLADHRKCPGTKTVSHPEAFWPEIVGILRDFFANPALPASIRGLESEACAVVRLREALQLFELGELDPATESMRAAFALAPRLSHSQRERVIRILVAYAGIGRPLETSREFLRTLFDKLPDNAISLNGLRGVVWRRIQILHALRSRRPDRVREARRLLPLVLLTDVGWLRDRRAVAELVGLATRSQAVAATASLWRLLSPRS